MKMEISKINPVVTSMMRLVIIFPLLFISLTAIAQITIPTPNELEIWKSSTYNDVVSFSEIVFPNGRNINTVSAINLKSYYGSPITEKIDDWQNSLKAQPERILIWGNAGYRFDMSNRLVYFSSRSGSVHSVTIRNLRVKPGDSINSTKLEFPKSFANARIAAHDSNLMVITIPEYFVGSSGEYLQSDNEITITYRKSDNKIVMITYSTD